MPVPDLRIAICRRCREESRVASGADSDLELDAAARAFVEETGIEVHVRRSQCLSCCDGGHTVRIERHGVEVALVGIRTVAELRQVLENLDAIADQRVPDSLASRVYQVWRDGDLVWHRQLSTGPFRSAQGASVKV